MADRLFLHCDGPGILHVALLVHAVAFRVQSTVEVEVDLFGHDGLSEEYAALAAREIGDGGKRGGPQMVLSCAVVDEVEDMLHCAVSANHFCSSAG